MRLSCVSSADARSVDLGARRLASRAGRRLAASRLPRSSLLPAQGCLPRPREVGLVRSVNAASLTHAGIRSCRLPMSKLAKTLTDQTAPSVSRRSRSTDQRRRQVAPVPPIASLSMRQCQQRQSVVPSIVSTTWSRHVIISLIRPVSKAGSPSSRSVRSAGVPFPPCDHLVPTTALTAHDL